MVPAICVADAMDYNGFTTFGFQGFFSWMDGRMGFEQQNAGLAHSNNFRSDLGLPINNQSYRIGRFGASAGTSSFDENLRNNSRTCTEAATFSVEILVTKNTIYPAGSEIESELKTSMFGIRYDLDFFIGPRWFGGLHGELRYIDFRVGLGYAGFQYPRSDKS